MIDLRFRPLQTPVARPKGGYRSSPFDLPWNRTLDHLERELGFLGAKDIVVEADLSPEKIRNDGWPYSSARPNTPGRTCGPGWPESPLPCWGLVPPGRLDRAPRSHDRDFATCHPP